MKLKYQCAVASLAVSLFLSGTAAAQTALRHEAYVWQRDWNTNVVTAVSRASGAIDRLVVLAAEASWGDQGLRVVRVSLPWPVLRSQGTPVGLALRVGACPGPFRAEAVSLGQLSGAIVASARAAGLEPAELQIDFDCAESKLNDYAEGLRLLRRHLPGVALTITALPCWLRHREFGQVLDAADGYVLQVHSVDAPAKGAGRRPLVLCDPRHVREWVVSAAGFGKPFRVALPTYGYLVEWSERGTVKRLIADGSAALPAGAAGQELALSDPVEMSALVREWNAARPPGLTSIIWYRLPVDSDWLTWTWPTLMAVMAGGPVRDSLRAVVSASNEFLCDVRLLNDGQVDRVAAPPVRVTWTKARLLGCDGIGGFAIARAGTNCVDLMLTPPAGTWRLRAGDTRSIGWLRFDRRAEAAAELGPARCE